MSRTSRLGVLVASLAVIAASVSGCASDSKNASPSASASASSIKLDAGLLKPTMTQWIRFSGVLPALRDTNATLITMQKVATTKITDAKSLASYVTNMQAAGTAAVLIGQNLSAIKAPDAGFSTAIAGLGQSMTTLGKAARALDAVKLAQAGKNGAAVIKNVLQLMGDAVTKTKAVATYAGKVQSQPITL